jgi:hypothetical protein
MSIAILSTVTSFAVYTAVSVRSSSEEVKLGRDVAVLNKALRQYEMSGGSLVDITEPQAVINKLKTRLTGDNKKQMAGLRGSVVDNRLRVELQDANEISTTKPRARYRVDTRQFEIVTTGSGIKRFVMDETLAAVDYGTESRNTTMKLAKDDKWVWDYNDLSPTQNTPSLPPDPAAPVAPPVPPDQALTLLVPPGYSRDSGTLPLNSFPLTVTLSDTNPTGSSEIHFSTNGGPFKRYENTLSFDPGAVVTAYAVSMNPDKYEDSSNALRDYRANPEIPVLRLTYADVSLTFAEMGGPMLPANTPGTPPEGTLQMTNRDKIPDIYENSGVFLPVWTLDGTNPLTSTTATPSPDFANGYPGNRIPVTLTSWPLAASSVTVRAAVRSLNTSIVKNSVVQQVTLNRQVTALLPPTITFADRDCTLTLDSSSGNMPAGARIFYTLDGSDPGDNAGEPLKGTLYGGPFIMEGAYQQVVRVTARTYPPASYKPWFTTSGRVNKDYTLPATVDVYVGGDFEQSGGKGSALRNIARLRGNGAVDTRFDTGAGASAGSLVGVVRQQGGGVLAGGDFDNVGGVNRPGLVRLLLNGAVDPAFDAGLAGGN